MNKIKFLFLILIYLVIISFFFEQQVQIGEYAYNTYDLNGKSKLSEQEKKAIKDHKYIIKIYENPEYYIFQSYSLDFLINEKTVNNNISTLITDKNGKFISFSYEYDKKKDSEIEKLDKNLIIKSPTYFYFKYYKEKNKITVEKKWIDENAVEKINSKEEYQNFEDFEICSLIPYSFFYCDKWKKLNSLLKSDNTAFDLDEINKIQLKIASFNFNKIIYFNTKIIDIKRTKLLINNKEYNCYNIKIKVVLPSFIEVMNSLFAKKNTIIDLYLDTEQNKILKFNDENILFIMEEKVDK